MDQRQPPGDATSGLGTTSAKIRALASAGYDRTEISQLLGIRYQHVRKVLLDAGIAGGLRRSVDAEREPITVGADPKQREMASASALTRASFLSIGEWTRSVTGELRLDAKPPIEPGVYGFVVDDVVVYVGVTNNALKTRLDQYRVGHKGQRDERTIAAPAGTVTPGGHAAVVIAAPANRVAQPRERESPRHTWHSAPGDQIPPRHQRNHGTEPLVTYRTPRIVIDNAGINPLPIQRPIPIWFGGAAEPALRRAARLGDGWMPSAC